MQKCEKIKNDSKNHNSKKTIDPTEFCLAPSEREKLALSELLISCVVSFGPKNLIWKKVEEYLRLFDSYGENFPFFP